ncbi:Apolipoprotein D [Armadillidium vulgare]|nr:Apolipoprotein D [Armadillidium vulgare]
MKLNILLIAIFAFGSQAEIRNGTCANVTPFADLEVAPEMELFTNCRLHCFYTDYETYSCVFSCDQITADSQDVFAWILARNVPLSQDTIDAALAVFESNGVDTSLFQEQTYQGDDCPYYNPTI